MNLKPYMLALCTLGLAPLARAQSAAPPPAPPPSQAPAEKTPTQTPSQAPADKTPAQPPAPVPSMAMSDANIAAATVTSNQIDVDAAKLALQRSKNAEVKKFAHEMVTDHEGVIKKAKALTTKLNITPEEDSTTKTMKSDAKDNLGKLKSASRAEFDRLYIENEVAYHQSVLDSLDRTLIPAAKNQDLKDLLSSVRPVVQQHLDHAQDLQKVLSGTESKSDSKTKMK
jgi:putative membrane protein